MPRDCNIVYQYRVEKVVYGKNTFKYHGMHIWNMLPNERNFKRSQQPFYLLKV